MVLVAQSDTQRAVPLNTGTPASREETKMKINSNLLIDLMATHGMKISELSRISGVSYKTIELLVDNIDYSVSKGTVIKIARALNVDPIRLEGGEC